MSAGQTGYEAYGNTAEWKTFDGREMPTWEELGAIEGGLETQRRWEVAAAAIAAEQPKAKSKRKASPMSPTLIGPRFRPAGVGQAVELVYDDGSTVDVDVDWVNNAL